MRFMQICIEYPEYIEMLFLLLNQDVMLKTVASCHFAKNALN